MCCRLRYVFLPRCLSVSLSVHSGRGVLTCADAGRTDPISRLEVRKLGGLKSVIALLSSASEEIQKWAVVALNHINEKSGAKQRLPDQTARSHTSEYSL